MQDPVPDTRPRSRAIYLLPNLFTTGCLFSGFYAIVAAIDGNYDRAGLAVFLAMLCDTLDGRVARMTKTATELGVQFDSLADVLTFGIAPIALMYSWGIAAALPEGSQAHAMGVFLLFMYLMCGAFRLARFNIQATRPRVLMEGTPKLDKKNFVGLPIPPAAGLLASIVHFSPMPLSAYGEGFSQFYVYLLMVLIAVLGVLMVSTLRYSSFKTLNFGRRNLYLVLFIAAAGMLMWLYSNYLLLILATAYVSHAVVLFLIRTLFRRFRTVHAPVDVLN